MRGEQPTGTAWCVRRREREAVMLSLLSLAVPVDWRDALADVPPQLSGYDWGLWRPLQSSALLCSGPSTHLEKAPDHNQRNNQWFGYNRQLTQSHHFTFYNTEHFTEQSISQSRAFHRAEHFTEQRCSNFNSQYIQSVQCERGGGRCFCFNLSPGQLCMIS